MASAGRWALSRLATLGVGRQATPGVKRCISTTPARAEMWQQEGLPGSNLPFSIHNRHKLALYFVIFFCSGLTAPFVIVRHQLKKK